MPPPAAPVVPLKAWIQREAVHAVLVAYRVSDQVEPCGLLLGTAKGSAVKIQEAVAIRNVHPTPDRAFGLDPEDQLRVAKDALARDLSVVGFWHGHLVGGPSPGQQDVDEFERSIRGPNSAWSKVFLLVGRGETGRPVLRAYAPARHGIREVPLRT